MDSFLINSKITKNPLQVSPIQIEKLIDEVEDRFVYAQHQMEFEADLPYNKEKQDLFSEILPVEKFIPYSERINCTDKIGVIAKFDYDFWKRVAFISQNLHQAFPDTLNILVKQNQEILEFKHFLLFNTFYLIPYSLEKMVRMHKLESMNTTRELRNIMFDTQFGIQDIINNANEERIARNNAKIMARAYENQSIDLENQLSPEFIIRLRKLLRLCNLSLEREMRICLERSLYNFKDQFQEIKNLLKSMEISLPCSRMSSKDILCIIQHEEWRKKNRKRPCYKCVLKFKLDQDEGRFVIEPGLDDVTEGIDDVIYSAVKEIQTIPTLETSELGACRDPSNIKVVEDSDEFVLQMTNEIKNLIKELWAVPHNLLQILKPYEFLISLKPKHLKSKFDTKFKLEQINEELNRCKDAQEGLDIIFGNKNKLFCGLFVIKIAQIKDGLQKKTSKLLEELERILVEKSLEHIKKIEEQEKEIINIIDHEPVNLEELNDMKIFITTQLQERLDYINNIINQLFDISETLENYGIRTEHELFYRSWDALGLSKRIIKFKKDCERTIKLKEKDFGDQLKESQFAIIKEIEDIRDILFELKKEKHIEKYEEMSNAFASLKDRIEKAIEYGRIINVREIIVGLRTTDLRALDSIKLEFTPYCKLWFYIRDFFYHLPI